MLPGSYHNPGLFFVPHGIQKIKLQSPGGKHCCKLFTCLDATGPYKHRATGFLPSDNLLSNGLPFLLGIRENRVGKYLPDTGLALISILL